MTGPSWCDIPPNPIRQGGPFSFSNMSSLDNFQDAVDSLRRDGVSFIIVQRRRVHENGVGADGGILYHVEGELHDPPCHDEMKAMAEAVRGYCEDNQDED